MSTSVVQSSIASSVPISEPVLVPEITGKVSAPSSWRTTFSAPTVNAPLAPPPPSASPMRGATSVPLEEAGGARAHAVDERLLERRRGRVLRPAVFMHRDGEHVLLEEVAALGRERRDAAPGQGELAAVVRRGGAGVERSQRVGVGAAVEERREGVRRA